MASLLLLQCLPRRLHSVSEIPKQKKIQTQCARLGGGIRRIQQEMENRLR